MTQLSADALVQLLHEAAPFATPHALGAWLLREDLQYTRIEPGRREALVDAALDDGYGMAERARERWGSEPTAIAAACGVSVVACDLERGWGTSVVYADYHGRTRSVRLFLPAIARLDRHLSCDAVAAVAGIRSARPALLAHELYHHLDAIRLGPLLARLHRVTLLRLGRWRWTSGLASLGEIAAGAFAQRLLGLRWHARFLDLIAIHDANPAAALRAVASLRASTPIRMTTHIPAVATSGVSP
jgi:hypothetical protein